MTSKEGIRLLAVLVIGLLLGVLVSRSQDAPKEPGITSIDSESSRVSQEFRSNPRVPRKGEDQPLISDAEAEMRRLGTLRDLPAVNYELLSEDGEINSYALDAAGLEYEDRDALKKIVHEALDEMSKVISSKTRMNVELTEKDRGYFVYDTPAFADEGSALIKKLTSQLEEKFGDEASKVLMNGLHTDRKFAGFGKFESRIEFDDNGALVDQFTSTPQFTLSLKDPKTGRIIYSVRSTKESLLRNNFGNSFLLKDDK